MTQGDIVTQGSGLLMNMARAVERKKQKAALWDSAIESFVSVQQDKTIQKIRYAGDNGAADFYFGADWPVERIKGGLEHFVMALKVNTEKGYIYKEAINIIGYVHAILRDKENNHAVFKIIDRINGTNMYYSPLTYYEKQKELLSFLEKLVLRLQQGNSAVNDEQGSVCNYQNVPKDVYIKISI